MKPTKPFMAAMVVAFASAGAAQAVTYDLLQDTFVSSGATVFKSQFNSLNGNGAINVTDTFASTAGVGYGENIDSYITPSQFSIVFPGTGSVQGHLGMTVYNNTATFYFDTSLYNITPQTVFGMWNITNEVTYPLPPGGNPVYRLQLFDGTNIVNPSTLTVFGKQDNTGAGGVNGQQEIDMDPLGYLTPGAVINGGIGTHTSATFWNNIPTGTQAIIVYADLPPLNTVGDGVGYYFAEVHAPEPASLAMLGAGTSALMLRRRRR